MPAVFQNNPRQTAYQNKVNAPCSHLRRYSDLPWAPDWADSFLKWMSEDRSKTFFLSKNAVHDLSVSSFIYIKIGCVLLSDGSRSIQIHLNSWAVQCVLPDQVLCSYCHIFPLKSIFLQPFQAQHALNSFHSLIPCRKHKLYNCKKSVLILFPFHADKNDVFIRF